MQEILINAFSLVMIIFFGYMSKKTGLLSKADGNTLSKIILNITLPSAIIIGLRGVKLEAHHFVLILIGVLFNALIVLFASLIWRKKTALERSFFMYNGSGYNIGNFTLVFLQSFFPAAIPLLCIFDIGNALMMFGGTKIMVHKYAHTAEKETDLKAIAKKLLRAVPFMTYIIMFLLKIFDIEFSSNMYFVIGKFASANSFLSMFMIGLFLELALNKKESQLVFKVLAWRYLYGILLGLIIYFLVPISMLLKTVLTLIVLSPIATITTINSIEAGIKEKTAGFISSASIIISLILMISFLMIK